MSVASATAQTWDATEAAATNRLKLPSGNVCAGAKTGVCCDTAGNVIFDNQLGAAGDRTYDAENRMVTAADGKRVRRAVGAQTLPKPQIMLMSKELG